MIMESLFTLTHFLLCAGTINPSMLNPLRYSKCVVLALLVFSLLRVHQRIQTYQISIVKIICLHLRGNQMDKFRGSHLIVPTTHANPFNNIENNCYNRSYNTWCQLSPLYSVYNYPTFTNQTTSVILKVPDHSQSQKFCTSFMNNASSPYCSCFITDNINEIEDTVLLMLFPVLLRLNCFIYSVKYSLKLHIPILNLVLLEIYNKAMWKIDYISCWIALLGCLYICIFSPFLRSAFS